jgi:hypothetical protein
MPAVSAIRNPAHYGGDVWWEHVKIAEQMGWGYLVGNATKYLWRIDKKTADTSTQDIEKAIWYLERRVKNLRRIESATGARISEWGARWWRLRTCGPPPSGWTLGDLLDELRRDGVPAFARDAIQWMFFSGLVPVEVEISALSRSIGDLRHEVQIRTALGGGSLVIRRGTGGGTGGGLPTAVAATGVLTGGRSAGGTTATMTKIPVVVVGDPEPSAPPHPSDSFDNSALAKLLEIDDATALALIRCTTTIKGKTIEEMARHVGSNVQHRTHDELRELVRTYCDCVRWADTKTPYRTDVDPEDPTRIG